MNDGTLWISPSSGATLFRLVGRGSFQNAGLLKKAAGEAWASGCRRIVIDLAECLGMDSTFLGVLAGMALRSQRDNGAVILSRTSPRNRDVLRKMGLHRLLTVEDAPAAAPTSQGQAIEGGRESMDQSVQTMIEAHHNLVTADPRNESRFQDVIDFLNESAKRRAGGA